MNKAVWVSFRLTYEERENLRKMANRRKLSLASYIREKIFTPDKRLPAEIEALLKDLKYNDLKIGTNINQVAKVCNSKQYASKEDYKKLMELHEELNRKRGEMVRILQKLQEG